MPTASIAEAEQQRREEIWGGPQMLPSRHRGFLQGTQGDQQLLSCCKHFCWRWCWEREVDYLQTPRENASQYIIDTAPPEKQSLNAIMSPGREQNLRLWLHIPKKNI